MFGLFRSMKVGTAAAEIQNLLIRNYGLTANPKSLLEFIQDYYDIYQNPHELAVGYATLQFKFMQRDNAEHIKSAARYIRVAKQAYKVGAAKNSWALSLLRTYADNYMGIDINSIDASHR